MVHLRRDLFGLVYEGEETSALAVSDDAIVINSFSKYFCMTGWRVGWMVVPERLVRPIERIAQNLFISVPEISQRAALAAFDAGEELEAVKAVYARNREILLARLPALGFDEILPADGAFYVYASVRRFSNDSHDFARAMLAEAGVAGARARTSTAPAATPISASRSPVRPPTWSRPWIAWSAGSSGIERREGQGEDLAVFSFSLGGEGAPKGRMRGVPLILQRYNAVRRDPSSGPLGPPSPRKRGEGSGGAEICDRRP